MATIDKSVKIKGEFLLDGMMVNKIGKDGELIGTYYLADLFKDLDGDIVSFTAAVKEEIQPSEVDASEAE